MAYITLAVLTLHPVLAGLESLSLYSYATPLPIYDDPFTVWPRTLRNLTVSGLILPPECFTASSTLQSLELQWAEPKQLQAVLEMAAELRQLRRLSIDESFGELAGMPGNEVPGELHALVRSLPVLSTLSLRSIYPTQLADILDSLASRNEPIHRLETTILASALDLLDDEGEPIQESEEKDEFMADLMRCAESPGLEGVAVWRFGVLNDPSGHLMDLEPQEVDRLFGHSMMNKEQEWRRFQVEVQKRGVQLLCGPGQK